MYTLKQLTNLINDSLSNKVGLFSEGSTKYTDEAIRQTFFDILGEDKLTWTNFRRHDVEIFEVIEEVLKTNLPLAWESSPFYDQFVEVRNAAIGQKNEFIVEDNSILVAANFSGNHWDTDRQKVEGRKSFSVQTSWVVLRIYQDLERFLVGVTSLAEMMEKLQKSFQAHIDSMIYASFNSIGNYLPSDFQETGDYDRDNMNTLIERVQTASQKEVILAGTRTALAHIAEGISSSWISAEQKREMATTGMLIENIGLPAKAVVIPQVFLRGSYDFKVNDKIIYVLPAESKPVKLFYEGDVRAISLDWQQTHDMTFDAQVQVKLGVGVVCDNMFGKYTFTN